MTSPPHATPVPGRPGYYYGRVLRDPDDAVVTASVHDPDGRRLGDVTALGWIGVNDQPGVHELAADLIDQLHRRR